jgi:hypothetical protein
MNIYDVASPSSSLSLLDEELLLEELEEDEGFELAGVWVEVVELEEVGIVTVALLEALALLELEDCFYL